MPNNQPIETEVISSVTIPKFTQDKRKQIGLLTIEVKLVRGYKFVQLTQEKFLLKNQAAKTSIVTFDVSNSKIKEAILDVFNK